MNCNDVKNRLNPFIDGELAPAEAEAVRAHTLECAACAAEAAALRTLRETAIALPRDIDPGEDLWPAIERVIANDASRPRGWRGWIGDRTRAGAGHHRVVWRAALAAAVVTAVALGVREWRARTGIGESSSAWEVTSLEGAPRVGTRDVTSPTPLARGEWLRTDADSRARLSVPSVGRVDVGPASAVRLLDADAHQHRIELAEGTLSAFIWAPPRLFFVETPSGVAEDLGCQYDLVVDRKGNGTLDVTLGFVSFERDGREVIVPDGARCELRAGVGPGTPHESSAPPGLRDALARFDFEGAHTADLSRVLDAVTPNDAVTLWHLIPRAEEGDRSRVVDRLATLVDLPDGVTREAVLALDKRALQAWWTRIYPEWNLWN